MLSLIVKLYTVWPDVYDFLVSVNALVLYIMLHFIVLILLLSLTKIFHYILIYIFLIFLHLLHSIENDKLVSTLIRQWES